MPRIKIEQQTDACPDCHGSKVVVVDVDRHGYSVGSDIDHAVICPQLKCKHGKITWGPIAFQQECVPCEEAAAAEHRAEEG